MNASGVNLMNHYYIPTLIVSHRTQVCNRIIECDCTRDVLVVAQHVNDRINSLAHSVISSSMRML